MLARVRTITVDLKNLDGLKEEWPRYPVTLKDKGLKDAFLVVDKKTGKGYSMTFWENEKAMKASEADPEFKKAYQILGGGFFEQHACEYLDVICKLR
ncbi:MAG: hypothetical protein EXQ86_06475 [Rhodospirillales bacterium]|nr:hypothetical protein [Rhodospirillales bacterium]